MPIVSVIIPVFNGEKYLRYAIESILSQTFRDFELIVIDDGSTDNTRNILENYEKRIIWRYQKNMGQAAAINKAYRIASGKYFAYLDSDDMCMPNRLEVQVEYLDRHPMTYLVYSDRYCINEYGKIIEYDRKKQVDQFSILQYNFIIRSSVMHRRECLDKVGLFDEKNTGNDDWDMWVRISEKFHMNHINLPLVKYRIHDYNISLNRSHKMNFNRWTKLKMLERAYFRNEKAIWIKLLIFRAYCEWWIGRFRIIGEQFPSFWYRFDKILDVVEQILYPLFFKDIRKNEK